MNPIKKMLEPIAFVIDLLGFLNIHLSVKLESRMKYAQQNYYLKQLEGINSLLCVEISKGFILIWTLDFFLGRNFHNENWMEYFLIAHFSHRKRKEEQQEQHDWNDVKLIQQAPELQFNLLRSTKKSQVSAMSNKNVD